MSRPRENARTPSADMVWHGKLRTEFRSIAEAEIGRTLDDEAWAGLCSVVLGYAMELSHEFVAASFVAQKRAVRDAVANTDALIASLALIESEEMGRIVSNRVSEKWEEFAPPKEASSEQDGDMLLASILEASAAAEDAESQATTDGLMASWYASEIPEVPSVAVDFMVRLDEFRQAIGLVSEDLHKKRGPRSMKGAAFTDFIGRLTEWADKHGLPNWSANQKLNHGRFTFLVKAVLEEVPIIYEAKRLKDGTVAKVPSQKQIRRSTVTDAGLAKAINTAQKLYDSQRPFKG